MAGPLLFCYDGSPGSQVALRAAGQLLATPSDGYVLTVWQPASSRLAAAGAFAPLVLSDEPELDDEEAASAASVADEGVRRAAEHGYDLRPLVERADEGVAHAILQVADRLDAALVICGQRGRGPVRSAVLGSVSHALASHTRRPVLISPDKV